MNGLAFLKAAFKNLSLRFRGPVPGIHRRVSQRKGVFNARGHKLSPMKLRCLEITGCNLEKAFGLVK